ncbi:Alpha-adducin [Amphibalanus amphitrite]|uniref:Alpha-adducin n=1 Tax=Amphibalanus amphitrite TaxID=1232801 RepID=A0A6A4WU75_AMPAM|nr:Alpha-adducin [Amphibalanus amphitrite]
MLRSLARLVRAAPPLPAETVLRRSPTVARLTRPFGSLPGLRPIAINDLGADCPYSAEEQAVRCKLASLYRLVDARGWSMGIYNHITVSTMQCGLLPITQEALVVHGFAGVSYHDYQGILINSAEKKDIQENLGPKNKVIVVTCALNPSPAPVH